MSSDQEYGMHREIIIASSLGNEELRTTEDKNIGGRILHSGGLVTSVNAPASGLSNLSKRPSTKLWSDDYHIFEIEWKSGRIVVKVDNVQYGEQTVDGAFGKPVSIAESQVPLVEFQIILLFNLLYIFVYKTYKILYGAEYDVICTYSTLMIMNLLFPSRQLINLFRV